MCLCWHECVFVCICVCCVAYKSGMWARACVRACVLYRVVVVWCFRVAGPRGWITFGNIVMCWMAVAVTVMYCH